MRTATSLEQPSNSMVISPPFLQTHSVPQIYRTSSLPGGMNEEGVNETVHISSPVQLRLSTSRLRRKAQYLRNSVAVTNSDYLNQWKPHMMHYQSPGGGGGLGLLRPTPSAPSLDTISEHELVADFQPKAVPLSPLVMQQQLADPNMFRYTSTPVLDPPRQVIPRPLSSSRPTTPVPPSVALESRPNTPPLLSPSTGYYRPFSVRRESSRAIPLSSHMENQFLPVYINPETGAVFMFEDGYYIPLVSKQIRQLQGDDESAGAAVTQPPVSVSQC